MKKAFSLIELLISLIVISLIIASFTPVLSKKLKHREVAYSKIKQMKIDCSPFNTSQGQCLLCDERQCNLCTSSINVPDGYYVNPNLSCNRKPCSDFNSNCKRCTKDGCQECKSGYNLNADGSCSEVKCGKGHYVSGSSCPSCPNGQYQPNDDSSATSCLNCSSLHANCSTCNAQTGCCSGCAYGYSLSGCSCSKNITCPAHCIECASESSCSKCENGYSLVDNKCGKYQEPTTQTDCGEYALFVSSAYNGTGKNLCVSKYNMGDNNGPTIPSDYHQLSVGSSTKCMYTDYKCYWVGNSAKSSNVSTKGSYSALNRTVFSTYDISTTGANLCKGWNYLGLNRNGYYWRLPTSSELTSWLNFIRNDTNARLNVFGYKGLDFCSDDSTRTEFSRCDSAESSCKTEDNSNCNPSGVMGSDLQYKDSKYYRFRLTIYSGENNTYKAGYSSSRMTSNSVRCVTDKIFK